MSKFANKFPKIVSYLPTTPNFGRYGAVNIRLAPERRRKWVVAESWPPHLNLQYDHN